MLYQVKFGVEDVREGSRLIILGLGTGHGRPGLHVGR
jgi:hypothetical protein